MQIKYKTVIMNVVVLGLFFMIAPHIAFAEGYGSSGGIENPLGESGMTITAVLAGVIKWMLGLVGFLALIALIVGGGRMVIDFGNEEQVKKGKTTILWAVIGLAVVILSYAILGIVTRDILGVGAATDNYGGSQGLSPNP